MSDHVGSVEELEAVVGKCSLGARMKEIDFLDDHCRRLLGASPFVVSATLDATGALRIHAHGGRPPVASVSEIGECRLPLHAGPAVEALAARADETLGVGALAFVPGLGETLRLNGQGRVAPAPGGEGATSLSLDVNEAFVHCAKALLRSSFWAAATPAPPHDASRAEPLLADPRVAAFLARSPFVLLASSGRAGGVDVSPKGDPPGFLMRLDPRTLAVPDRPGNQRADTFRNVLETGRVALLALVPGDLRVAHVGGRARLSTDAALLARMAVERRTPKLALVIDVDEVRLEASPALAAADLWNTERHPDLSALPSPAAVLRDHVKQNRTRGVGATLLRAAVSERVIEGGLRKDYRERLY